MKKLITTAFLVVFGAFALTSAKAELSLSGYQEFYAVSVDQTTSAGLDTATQTLFLEVDYQTEDLLV